MKLVLQTSAEPFEGEAMGHGLVNIQSNHQENYAQNPVTEVESRVNVGWENDESLEEIDTPRDNNENSKESEDYEGYGEDNQLNRSISANEQISDALDATP